MANKEDQWRKAGELCRAAIKLKKDEPKLKILELMENEMEMSGGGEIDWNKVIHQSRKIWENQ